MWHLRQQDEDATDADAARADALRSYLTEGSEGGLAVNTIFTRGVTCPNETAVDAAREHALTSFLEDARPASSGELLAAERTSGRHLHALLDAEEIASIITAAHAMAQEHDGCSYKDLLVAYGNAHAALYMHKGGYFGRALPALQQKLISQMCSQCSWPLRRPDALTIRCIEFHTYTPPGALMDPGHRDKGSIISMSVLLSDAAEHDGGRFITWEDCSPTTHELARGDAVLFPSEKVHNVSPLSRGVRQSLVIELWEGKANAVDRYS